MMDEIIKLIEITRKKGQRSIQLVNQNFRKKEISRDNLLYEGIITGKFSDDEKAAKEIFNSDSQNRNFRNAKSKLKEKLLNHLFFLDYGKENCTYYEKTEYECLNALRQCRIIVSEGEGELAVKILPYWIKTASELEIVDVVIEGLRILRNEYALSGKTSLFNETETELLKYQLHQEAIRECEQLYYGTIAFIRKSVNSQTKVLPTLPNKIKFLQKKAVEHKSNSISLMATKLNILQNSLIGDYKKNLTLCNEVEKKFLEKPNSQIKVNLKKSEICFVKLNAYYLLRQFSEGCEYSEKNLHLFRSGCNDWFRFMEYYFLMLMKSARFKKAGEVYRNVRTSKSYNSQGENTKERWQIYRASLLFMFDTKLLRWGFDLEQFVNTVPAYSKDKHNLNVITLILQFFYLLKDGKVNDMKVRLKELQKYNSFHLDKRHNYRNSLFIRLLLIAVEKEFNIEQIEEKGANYYHKLSTTFIPTEDDLEVIPFEMLWHYLINTLRTNKYYLHYRFYSLYPDQS